MLLLKLIVLNLIIGLFIYSKLLPHSHLLLPQTRKYYVYLEKIYKPICAFLTNQFNLKWEVGMNGLKMDLSQLIVLGLLLTIYGTI